jgi:hypothetical protein
MKALFNLLVFFAHQKINNFSSFSQLLAIEQTTKMLQQGSGKRRLKKKLTAHNRKEHKKFKMFRWDNVRSL